MSLRLETKGLTPDSQLMKNFLPGDLTQKLHLVDINLKDVMKAVDSERNDGTLTQGRGT